MSVATADMRIAPPDTPPIRDEMELLDELLELDGATIVELGCGRAERSRAIAASAPGCTILAYEVDAIQHATNLAAPAPDNLEFRAGGAEAIDLPDASVDVVLMFKSLHHVPVAAMSKALAEIARVLRPGARAYISEPVFAGAFNEVLRLFHDEEAVREAAFAAMRDAVDAGVLELETETFFLAPTAFTGFDEFEQRIIRATHTDHRLSATTLAEVRRRFAAHVGPDGARFEAPMRVDVLRRPEA